MDSEAFHATIVPRTPEVGPTSTTREKLHAYGERVIRAILDGDVSALTGLLPNRESRFLQEKIGSLTERSSLELLEDAKSAAAINAATEAHAAKIIEGQSRIHIPYVLEVQKGRAYRPPLAAHNMELLKLYIRQAGSFSSPMRRLMGGEGNPLVIESNGTIIEPKDTQHEYVLSKTFSYQLELDALIATQFLFWKHRLPCSALLASSGYDRAMNKTNADGIVQRTGIDMIIVSDDLQNVIPVQIKTRGRNVGDKPAYTDGHVIIDAQALGSWLQLPTIVRDEKGRAHSGTETYTRSGAITKALNEVVMKKRPFPESIKDVADVKNVPELGILYALEPHMPEARTVIEKLAA